MPGDEQQCAVQALGQARLDEILNEPDTSSDEEDLVFQQCLSQETLARVVVGGFISEVGNLSDGTMDCIWATLEGVDLMSLVQGDGDASGAFLGFIGMTLCLSDEEVAQAEASDVVGEFPIGELRCLAERVDEEDLASLFNSGAEDAFPSLDILAAMIECGAEMGSLDDEGSQFTPEQLTCLRDAVGDETLAQMFDQEGELSFDLIFSMMECGMEMGGLDDEGSQFTPEQLTCLRDTVGDESLTQMLDQEGDPPLDLIFAMLECGFATPDEGDTTGSTLDGVEGLTFTPEQLACVQDSVGDGTLEEIISGERLPTFEEILSMANCDLDILGLTDPN